MEQKDEIEKLSEETLTALYEELEKPAAPTPVLSSPSREGMEPMEDICVETKKEIESIPEFIPSASSLRRGVHLCGPAATGKTVLALHLSSALRRHIDRTLTVHVPGDVPRITPIPMEDTTNGKKFSVSLKDMMDIIFAQRQALILDEKMSTQLLQMLLNEGPHKSIFTFVCTFDETYFPVTVRKGFGIIIFTCPKTCAVYFDRLSNNFPRALKELASKASKFAFAKPYRKLVFIPRAPDGQHFFHITAKPVHLAET